MRLFFVALALVLLSALAFAVPASPTGLQAGFEPNGIGMSWSHESAGSVGFRIYRSESENSTPALIATVHKTSFLDTGTLHEKEYWYYITAFDASGESISVKFSVTNPVLVDKPFSVTLVSPKENSFTSGQVVEFVVKVDSNYFDEIQNLRAVLVNEALGTSKEFEFDAEKKLFTVSEEIPYSDAQSSFSTAYKILATGTFRGEEYSEPLLGVFTIAPVIMQIDYFSFFVWITPIFVMLFIGGLSFRRYLQNKARSDVLELELLEVEKERIVWKTSYFKRQITPEQYREKESELMGKENAIEQKLGRKVQRGVERVNPFEGFAPNEAEEVIMLVRSLGKPKKHDTPESLRARLVGLGRSDKVAKKVVNLVFKKHPVQ